jgi:hypothetical protein
MVATFMLRLVAVSLEGRRGMRVYTPTAVSWYGASASKTASIAARLVHRKTVTSIGPMNASLPSMPAAASVGWVHLM